MKIQHAQPRHLARVLCLVAASICASSAQEQTQTGDQQKPAWIELGGAKFADWQGLEVQPEGAARWKLPGTAIYRVPDGPRGEYRIGLWTGHDSVLDMLDWFGLRFDVRLEGNKPLKLKVTASIPPQESATPHYPPSTTAEIVIGEPDSKEPAWQTVTISVSSFDFWRGQRGIMKQVKELAFEGTYEGREGGNVELRNVRLVRGDILHLSSDLRSQPANEDGVATYQAMVSNSTDTTQRVSLVLDRHGWEGMPATVEPEFLTLPPGASDVVTVRVEVPKQLPPGAQETQVLLATPRNGKPERIEFITLQRLPSPFLMHDAEGWEEVRSKVQQYDWAKKEKEKIVAEADRFVVPEIAKGDAAKSTDPQKTPALFNTYIEQKMFPAAVAWQLTRDKKYAEKVAEFLRRFASPTDGYTTTLHAVKGDIPQEGGAILGFARAYDMIQDAGVLSAEDKTNIEQAFRTFVRLQVDGLAGSGGISNWSVFNICPAAQCALLLHDMASFNTLMYDTNGVVDHLRYGTMDDGWWYEMSIGYNLGCAEEMTALGIAARPFGVDFLEAKFPASLSQKVGLRRFEFTNFAGMAFGKFGPVKSPWVSVKKMWDGILPYPDYRSVIFGIGDSHDTKVSGGRFEMAYYAYRDPAYVPLIKMSGERDLIFGVPELPEVETAPYSTTARADNAGVAVLRSQTKGREPREQIQAVLKYGTHGSYHGHFDRLALNTLMRYGRSFWNPETSWYGYGHFMYKMWVQPSMSHNMVVVDGKMQEPTEAETLVFHAGDLMQVIGVENTARWSNPPFLGGYDEHSAKIASGDMSYLPIPPDAPTRGEVTQFTEPVQGRRLMIVTDDYVVLADNLRGKDEHQFDNIFHLRGARLENANQEKLLGREAQFDTNPLSSGQFITDVKRYAIKAPAIVRSETKFPGIDASGKEWKGENWNTGGYNDKSEPGILKVDEYVLWPKEAELLIGRYAEAWWPTHKKLEYAVNGDGKPLASGVFSPWILGSGTVDVDVKGLKSLELSTTVTGRRDNKGNFPPSQGTIFWGNACLVRADGKEIPLTQLKLAETNILPNPDAARGKDYSGGQIFIAGNPYESAVAAEPKDSKQPGLLTIDLAGLDAVRFRATVGGDWTIGNEDQLRKTVSVRTRGKSAQFLTLLEPYEDASMIKSAVASGPDALRVELTDGRVQEIKISGLDSDRKDVQVEITETKDGKVLRSETTAAPPLNRP